MNKQDLLNRMLNEEGGGAGGGGAAGSAPAGVTSTASVLGDPGSPTYGGFIGPLSRISKKKLNSRIFSTWKQPGVKNGAGLGKLAVAPQGYIKEHIYSTEGKMVTENDLLEWFGGDLSQKPAYNGGKLVTIEPKCLAFPYCSQGAVDHPIKLIGESKDQMCESCYGYCSHIAEATGKTPEHIAKIIREKYLNETMDLNENVDKITVSFEEVDVNGEYYNFDAEINYVIEHDIPADRHPDDPSTMTDQYIDFDINSIKNIEKYNDALEHYEPVESTPELSNEIRQVVNNNSNYREYIIDTINNGGNQDNDHYEEDLEETEIQHLDESIELKNNNLENTNTMENINMTPQFASECMSGIMENNHLAECMYEALIHEGFLPETLEEGDTYEGHCKTMMEDSEICMEMLKSCMMNESSSCANEVNNYISECWSNMEESWMNENPEGFDPYEKLPNMEEETMEESDPASKFAKIYAQLEASIEKNGARQTGVKLINMFIGRMLPGMGTSDLADTATFANGLDTIEEYLENGDYQEAIEEAKNTAEAMLEDEGMGMFDEGYVEEAEGINPAIYKQLKHCVEHGHTYEQAKEHVAQAVDGWHLSMEDWNEAKKKFGKEGRKGVELEEKWMEEGWMEEGELEEGGDSTRYMFFSNLEQIKRQAELLLNLDEAKIEAILNSGHDWAADHLTVAKEDLSQVFDFLMNEIEGGKEPEGDMTPAPVDMGGEEAPMGPEDNIDEELMEYEDFEDDEDGVKTHSGQYETQAAEFNRMMNEIEKSLNVLGEKLNSSESAAGMFDQYYGHFASTQGIDLESFVEFLKKHSEESPIEYYERLFSKGPNQSALALLVSPTKRGFLDKTGLMSDENLVEALDTVDDLANRAGKKASFMKSYDERQDKKHHDVDDDFDEKEPSMRDLKNIEKMTSSFDDEDDDFIAEAELPKFNPIKGKAVDSDNAKNEKKETKEGMEDAEDSQETTEEKVDNMKNQKFSPNMETESQKETKELATGYKNALNLDYTTEPSEDYKKRVEMEVKTGHSRERDSELGEEANVDNESKAGEKIWNASKENQANADYDWSPNPIVTADQEYEKTSVSGKVKDGSKGNKVNEAVDSELEKMKKMFTYDQQIISEEKKVKLVNEDDIFWKNVSKKKLL